MSILSANCYQNTDCSLFKLKFNILSVIRLFLTFLLSFGILLYTFNNFSILSSVLKGHINLLKKSQVSKGHGIGMGCYSGNSRGCCNITPDILLFLSAQILMRLRNILIIRKILIRIILTKLL